MMRAAMVVPTFGTSLAAMLLSLTAGAAEPSTPTPLSGQAQPAVATSGPAAKPQPASAGSVQPLNTAASAKPPATSASPTATTRRSTDRIDLETTIVTGNRELPKVLYIVPWKKADLGELPAQPFNTLLDEALTPVDRDVFRREVAYYGAVSSGANSAAGAAKATPGSEK
jgi:hypothetical protein